MNALTRLDLSPFTRGTIGLDRLLNSMIDQPNNYPPYNIIYVGESDNQSSYRIELAVAGFDEDELEVTVKDSKLSIVGTKSTDRKEPDYAYKGISTKNFTQSFTLGEYVEVTGASVKNGLLQIDLERNVPAEKQPKKIEITFQK